MAAAADVPASSSLPAPAVSQSAVLHAVPAVVGTAVAVTVTSAPPLHPIKHVSSAQSLSSFGSSHAGIRISSPALHSSCGLVNKPSTIEYGAYRFVIMDAPTDSNLAAYIELLTRKRVRAIARACEPTYSTRRLLDAGIAVLDVPFADGAAPPQAVIERWMQLVEQVCGPADQAAKHRHQHKGSRQDAHRLKDEGEEKKQRDDTAAFASAASNGHIRVGGAHSGKLTIELPTVTAGSSSSLPSPAVSPSVSSPKPGPFSPAASGSSPALFDHLPAIGVHCVAGLGRAPVLVCIALMHAGLSAHDAVQLVRKKRRGAINTVQLEFLEKYRPTAPAACCVIC